MELKKRYEWMHRGSTCGMVVSCHGEEGDFTWCVYALVYENHPEFSNPEKLIESLPFHRGCTYDEKYSTAPARGIRYDWQKEHSWLKIGCDYHHYGDDYYQSLNPEDGLPQCIINDAQKIFNSLNGVENDH